MYIQFLPPSTTPYLTPPPPLTPTGQSEQPGTDWDGLHPEPPYWSQAQPLLPCGGT